MKTLSLRRKSSPKPKASEKRLNAEELEARVLYSGAPVAFVDDAPQEVASPVSAEAPGNFESLHSFFEDHSLQPAALESASDMGMVTLTSFDNLSDQEIAHLGALPAAIDTFPVNLDIDSAALTAASYEIQTNLDSGTTFVTGLTLRQNSFAPQISSENFSRSWDSLSEIATSITHDSGATFADQLISDDDGVDESTPHFELFVNGAGRENLQVAYTLTGDEPVTVQYRAGTFGAFTNIPHDLMAATPNGDSTDAIATLPYPANGNAQIQVRFLTANPAEVDSGFSIGNISISSDLVSR